MSEAAPPKHSLFNKPSWSKPETASRSEDFFHRSRQTYADVAAEQEIIERKKLARRARKGTRPASSDEREGKRRRVADDSDGRSEDGNSSSDENPYGSQKVKNKVGLPDMNAQAQIKSASPTRPTISPRSLSKRYDIVVSASDDKKPGKSTSDVIDLEIDGEADDKSSAATLIQAKASLPLENEDFGFSDEEFPELARKAREKARRKRLQADTIHILPDPLLSTNQDERYNEVLGTKRPTPPPTPPDSIVSILITSRIPNSQPLIVNRRLSQRLKEVRVTWCHKQGFSLDMTATVLLIWRGKRMFDITSCKSLGIGLDVDGNIVTKGQRDVLGEENRQIHMEAMTEEMFRQIKKAKAQGVDGGIVDQNTVGVVDEAPQTEKELQVRIILKAKGFEEFKLIVKPSTTVSRIVNAFRIANKIGQEKEVFLLFDGDRLEPQIFVGDTDISDLDYIDVYVK